MNSSTQHHVSAVLGMRQKLNHLAFLFSQCDLYLVVELYEVPSVTVVIWAVLSTTGAWSRNWTTGRWGCGRHHTCAPYWAGSCTIGATGSTMYWAGRAIVAGLTFDTYTQDRKKKSITVTINNQQESFVISKLNVASMLIKCNNVITIWYVYFRFTEHSIVFLATSFQ